MNLNLKLSVAIAVTLVLLWISYHTNNTEPKKVIWKGPSKALMSRTGDDSWFKCKFPARSKFLKEITSKNSWTREKAIPSPMLRDMVSVANFIFEYLPT
ncbi:hypothetical protein JTB14_001705 [Gonioctena quinquepunctata]|nr:hypothetical protein JTB14_001705 [Gonioctena quinquepunctata]